MREIKFRAWDKKRKEMRIINLDLFPLKGRISSQVCCTENEIIIQFTGLKDKNGKEIYEGDIVIKQTKFDGGRNIIQDGRIMGKFIVKWNHDNCGFDITNTGGHHYEIIGNIYENPELLEEKNENN